MLHLIKNVSETQNKHKTKSDKRTQLSLIQTCREIGMQTCKIQKMLNVFKHYKVCLTLFLCQWFALQEHSIVIIIIVSLLCRYVPSLVISNTNSISTHLVRLQRYQLYRNTGLTNIQSNIEPPLWPWPWTQHSNLFIRHSSLWWCIIKLNMNAKGSATCKT